MTPSYVYIIQGEESLYKIGSTRHVERRLRNFAGLPFQVRLVHTIESENARALELRIHRIFAAKQVRGEWFRLSDDDLVMVRQITDKTVSQFDMLHQSVQTDDSKRSGRGTALGFYFPLSKDDANDVRARLNIIAAELGFIAQGGPTAGEGNAAALLVAIAEGKVNPALRSTNNPTHDGSSAKQKKAPNGALHSSIGFYFRVSKEEANDIRARLNKIAAELGFVSTTGPSKGQGVASQLLMAIANGEVILMQNDVTQLY